MVRRPPHPQRMEVISRALVGGRASSPKLRCRSPLWTQFSETQATDQISVQLAFAGELALPHSHPSETEHNCAATTASFEESN